MRAPPLPSPLQPPRLGSAVRVAPVVAVGRTRHLMDPVVLEAQVPGESWGRHGGHIDARGGSSGLHLLVGMQKMLCEWPVPAAPQHMAHAGAMGRGPWVMGNG